MISALTDDQKIYHLLSRTSFGPTPEEVKRVSRIGIDTYVDEQLNPESISDSFVATKVAALKSIRISSAELFELYPPPRAGDGPKAGKAMTMSGPRVIIYELQQARLLRAVYSRRQLYEIMVDFWTNHFNIFAAKGADRWLVTSYDRDTIRPHALGRFADLLRATAESPAMLFYLDNWLSSAPRRARLGPNDVRRGLNENYAREIMELHTVGVDGGYTQQDVHEVARCFTGWTMRRPRGEAQFIFEPRIHDDAAKTVLGVPIPADGGINDGLRVIDILARHPSTARFIATKLARRFVSEDPPSSIVNRAAASFRQSDGDIAAVLRTIFSAPEFFAAENYQVKIKKPLEFVASALRATGAETRVTPQLLRYLGRMGERLFLAQPPTGYPDTGSSWISPDMLLTCLNFASDLVSNRIPGSRVHPERILDAALFAAVLPSGKMAPARGALNGMDSRQALALLLAAPQFHRR